MSIGYTWGKLSGAVLTLASSDGTLPQRLASALREIQTLQSADFPDEALWQDYQTLLRALTPGAPGGAQGHTHAAPAVLRRLEPGGFLFERFQSWSPSNPDAVE